MLVGRIGEAWYGVKQTVENSWLAGNSLLAAGVLSYRGLAFLFAPRRCQSKGLTPLRVTPLRVSPVFAVRCDEVSK